MSLPTGARRIKAPDRGARARRALRVVESDSRIPIEQALATLSQIAGIGLPLRNE